MKKKDIQILLVDDEPDILEIVGYNLSSEGYQVITADNGAKAVKLAQKHKPHLIILDVMMPEMDGLELLGKIKGDLKTQGIPVIGFTAGDVEYYRRKSLIPFDILVPKPMDFWDLHQLAKKKALTDLN